VVVLVGVCHIQIPVGSHMRRKFENRRTLLCLVLELHMRTSGEVGVVEGCVRMDWRKLRS